MPRCSRKPRSQDDRVALAKAFALLLGWFLVSALAWPAVAQVQPGRALVVDSATSIPLVGANVALREGTLAVVSQRTNDSGHVVLRAPRSGAFTLEIRAIGFATQVRQVRLDSGEVINGVFRLAQLAIQLDTVTTRDARPGIFGVTPGREFYRRHFERGIGQFISGLEIQFSKLGLIEFLGTIPGLQRVPSVPLPVLERAGRAVPEPNTPPTIGGKDGYLLSTGPERCLYGRIDHWPIPALLDLHEHPFIDVFLTAEDVMAVEVYAPSEVPPEWGFFAHASIVWVSWGGIKYLVGDTGPASLLRGKPIEMDRQGRINISSFTSPRYLSHNLGFMNPPKCAFVQIWTRIGW